MLCQENNFNIQINLIARLQSFSFFLSSMTYYKLCLPENLQACNQSGIGGSHCEDVYSL